MSVLETVDALVDGPVLVFGRPPPEGRDLDLLARPAEERALTEGLQRHGFVRGGKLFASFRDCSVDVVELVPAADWGLPETELDALFALARRLDGATNVLRPAPPHALLILARKTASRGQTPKTLARLASILAEQPDAFEGARRSAPAWGATKALDALEDGSRRRLPSRPRRGTLITLSGLDGAGKSSQATALRDALDRLGHDAVVEWSSLSQHPPLLHAITKAVRWLLGRRGGPTATSAATKPDPGKALRERSGAVTFAWATLVALTNAVGQSRAAGRHLWRGRVVICDRYTLDSKVHLRYAYGEERRFRFQTALIRLLSPRPDRAYLLDVSADTASSRKQDYPLEENARRCRLYREEAGRLGIERLDGERPRGEICSELAREVWELLRNP